MKSLMLGAAVVGAFVYAPSASAGGSRAGLVSGILSLRAGRMFFEVNAERYSKPACATFGRWVVDTTTPAGQAMAAQVLTAYSLGKTLSVEGTNDCAIWGDTETANYVQLP